MNDTIVNDKQKDIIGNILLFSLFILEVIYLYSASDIPLIVGGILGIVILLYIQKYKGFLLYFIDSVAVLVVVLISVNRIFILNCSWRGCLRIIFISLPIAYLLCKVQIKKNAAIIFFYLVFIYTVIMILIADPVELYRIFAASSRNYISVLLIACTFPYYLACSREHTEVSIFPALLAFLVSLYVQSRGGIIASGILFGLSFIRRIYLAKEKDWFKKRKKLIYVLIALAVLLGMAIFIINANKLLSRFFEAEEYTITRSDMWKEYLTVTGSSVKSIILGPPLTTCPLILEEGYNIHNSYFMVHSYTGIVGFLAVIAGGIGYLVMCIKKKEYNLLFLAVTFLVRAMTDYLFPMLFCDCIILFMIIQVGMEIKRVAYDDKKRKVLNNSDSGI
ncbi:MAG: hypothetical protein J6N21_18495 [Butyrivibrio sp.]|nr:hypothetical protein [Butyrivibrio sp.]